jgi:hypothetical protein
MVLMIGEIPADQVQLLGDGKPQHPGQSSGMDSNWILNVLMGSDDKNSEVAHDPERVNKLLVAGDAEAAAAIVSRLRETVGNSYAVQRAASSIEFFKIHGK